MFGQVGDVVLSLAQRRDLDEEDAQPVVEVLAKAARRDLAGEIAIGGRDESYVDVARAVLSYALVLAFLNGAEELGLQLERDLADLVEKERAAVGRLEPAYPIPEGAGNAPFTWPKNSLSNRSRGIAPQFTRMSGRSRRRLWS